MNGGLSTVVIASLCFLSAAFAVACSESEPDLPAGGGAQPVQILPEHGSDRELEQIIEQGLRARSQSTIVVLIGLDGEVVPCGCSDGQRGGLIKYASLLRSMRAESTVDGFVSLGDNLLSRWVSIERYQASAKYYDRRAGFLHEAIRSLGPAAYAASNHEKSLHQHLVSEASWLSEKRIAELEAVRGSESYKVALSITPATSANAEQLQDDASATLPADSYGSDAAWLVRLGAVNSEPGNESTVVLSVFQRNDGHWNLAGTAQLAAPERGGRDLQLLRLYFPTDETASDLVDYGEVAIIRAVSAHLDPDSRLLQRYRKRVREQLAAPVVLYHWEARRVAISYPDDPDVKARYQSFNREAALGGPLRGLKEPRTYAATCSPCHAEITEYFLSNDHHVHAIDTLRRLKNGSDENLACVTCHTTPRLVEKEGIKSYELHEGVLCGSCHTNADAHARRPQLTTPLAVERSICETCHNSVQSPNYQHDAHWKQLGCVKIVAKTRKGG